MQTLPAAIVVVHLPTDRDLMRRGEEREHFLLALTDEQVRQLQKYGEIEAVIASAIEFLAN